MTNSLQLVGLGTLRWIVALCSPTLPPANQHVIDSRQPAPARDTHAFDTRRTLGALRTPEMTVTWQSARLVVAVVPCIGLPIPDPRVLLAMTVKGDAGPRPTTSPSTHPAFIGPQLPPPSVHREMRDFVTLVGALRTLEGLEAWRNDYRVLPVIPDVGLFIPHPRVWAALSVQANELDVLRLLYRQMKRKSRLPAAR